MTGVVVEVEGAARLAATLAQAARRIAATAPADQAAVEAIRRAARPPVQSGWLASSAVTETTPEGAQVGWTAVYAGVIDNGWPARNIRGHHFAQAAAQVADWTTPYETHVQAALDTVKGK